MTTTKHQAEITADPELPMIRIVREFDAPPAKVFRAHTDPEILAKWMGPNDRDVTVHEWDCRNRGSFRYSARSEGHEAVFNGCFHEIRPPELIVQTFTYEGQPDGVALERLVFEDLGDGRTRLSSTSLCESFADRDMWMASGMEKGVNEGYDRLDELLAE